MGGNWPDAPAAAPFYYLLYRDSADKVQFIKLNIVSARLFELLSNDALLSGRAALERIAAELHNRDPERVVIDGTEMLRQ